MSARKFTTFAASAALSGVVIGLTASPASAQGFRVEAHAGWDRLSNDGVRDDGILYGFGLGYDLALGKGVVIGAEANADFSTIKECETGVVATGDELCVRATRDLSAVARVGFTLAPRSQAYVLAGYTNGRFRSHYTPASGAEVKESESLHGLRLGAGFQHGFGNGVYSKVEYRYSNYEAGAERHQVIAGVGVNF